MLCLSCGAGLVSSGTGGHVCVACAFTLALDAQKESDPWTPVTQDSDAGGVSAGAAQEGDSIGSYRLKRILGEGGMGSVWEAVQEEPVQRRVALKRIKLGMDSAQVLARFESERQALAVMNHPNIARVYDAGSSSDGRPYFAMEYVEGPWITNYCDEHCLDLRVRLDIFHQVCRGVEHAHQRGVIHRDIKPSNVLVSTEEGRPVPKIIDFGVAKATGGRQGAREPMTRIGQFLGTPEYMSPEQAGATSFDVDTRTDVYSLGVLLYELLTGHLPFEIHDGDESDLKRRIRTDDPPTCSARVAALGDTAREIARRRCLDPTVLVRRLRGDLDWITSKALEKDRARRYGTPSELAADITRYTRNQPVLARRPGAAYRMWKFARRHRLGVSAAIVGLAGVSAFAALMAASARRIAAEREQAYQASAFLASMLGRVNPHAMGTALWMDLRDSVTEAGRRRGTPKERIEATLASLDAALSGVNPTDSALRLLDGQVLGPAADSVARDMKEQPLLAGSLEQRLADTYFTLGLYGRAEEHVKRAVEIRKGVLGAEHPETLESMSFLATVYLNQARFPEAEALSFETLETRRRVLGEHDPAVLASQNNLANVYWRQNRLEEGEALHRRTLEERRRLLGPDHPDSIKSMQNLASVLDRQERYDEAVAMNLEALDRLRRAKGPDDPGVLGIMNGLANCYMRQHRFDEAERLHRETLERRGRTLGREHPDTLRSINNLANVIWAIGRFEEAGTLHREALEIRRRVLVPDHVDTLSSLHNLANVYKDQGRYDLAERHFLEALEGRRRALPKDHPLALDDMYALGCVASLKGDRGRALDWLGQAVDGGYKDHGDSAPMSEDTDLKRLRGDPRFEALVARARRGD